MSAESRENRRAWRDIAIQMTASIMIPLTIAGTGLYYTRWQQNVNDLKTMIDLVSDDKPERQKYGVAVFEYLLKNDKVPAEFVAAQLEYAKRLRPAAPRRHGAGPHQGPRRSTPMSMRCSPKPCRGCRRASSSWCWTKSSAPASPGYLRRSRMPTRR